MEAVAYHPGELHVTRVVKVVPAGAHAGLRYTGADEVRGAGEVNDHARGPHDPPDLLGRLYARGAAEKWPAPKLGLQQPQLAPVAPRNGPSPAPEAPSQQHARQRASEARGPKDEDVDLRRRLQWRRRPPMRALELVLCVGIDLREDGVPVRPPNGALLLLQQAMLEVVQPACERVEQEILGRRQVPELLRGPRIIWAAVWVDLQRGLAECGFDVSVGCSGGHAKCPVRVKLCLRFEVSAGGSGPSAFRVPALARSLGLTSSSLLLLVEVVKVHDTQRVSPSGDRSH
mmetsp:Transcript_113191/g.315167  ORF Transcript_113191/g.315167 Transcript_113191/m.315167 type:complete len:287 (-) Transcript_113191:3-863(-)